MYELIEQLEKQKRIKILNAAYKEFITNGYDKASTNSIIKAAKISKGSLFNYFKTKKGLYLYLLDYSSKIIEKIYEQINYNNTDLIERFKEIGEIKLKLMKDVPLAFDFLKKFSEDTSPTLKDLKEKKHTELVNDGFKKIYKNIDYSKFRQDLDLNKIITTINATLMNLSETENKKVNSFGNVESEVLEYFDNYYKFFKKAFYKKEFH